MTDTLDRNRNELQERIYTEYKEKVARYVRGKIRNPHEAEDIVSDVFVKVFAGLNSFDQNKASLSTWIYTVTRNTVTDHFRTAKQFCEVSDGISAGDGITGIDYMDGMDGINDINGIHSANSIHSVNSIDETIVREETLARLAEALIGLAPRDRDIIVLHYYSGQTLKDIALKMDISYSYVKLLHSRALKALRVIMEN